MSPSSASYLDDDFQALVEKVLQEHHVPGISIAVVDDDEIESKGYGHASLPDVAATSETLYYTGSTTKAMIAATLSRLMDEKSTDTASKELQVLQRDRWATKIKDILPEDFVLEDTIATANTTIEDALSHRTGMPGCDRLYGEWMGERPKTLVKALRHAGPLSKLFRDAWQYNNIMYSVLGDMIETITGAGWGSVLRKLLWRPLDMQSTFWHIDEVSEADRGRMAKGYYWAERDGKKAEFLEEEYVRFAGIAPAGSTISSVDDYTKYMRGLLRAAPSAGSSGNADEAEIISPTLLNELLTPRVIDTTPSPSNSALSPRLYALGWILRSTTAGPQHPVFLHAGGLTGFGTQLYILPLDGFGCVSMGNTAGTSNLAGEIACVELIAKKLGLRGAEKDAFIESLAANSKTAEATAGESNGAETNGSVNAAEPSTSAVKSYLGQYTHPAYGTYSIQLLSTCKGRERINTKRDQIIPQGCLLVAPIGHRTWEDLYLLRPRRHIDSESSRTFYDFQHLEGHGKGTAVPDYPDGSNDPLHTCALWELKARSTQGACFQSCKEQSASTLGLRLANPYMLSDGGTHERWESEMAWFVKDH